MYVCLCHAVTDADIKRSVEAGNRTLRQVSRDLKVGTGCGTCVDCARSLIKDLVKDNPPAESPGDDEVSE